MAMHSLAPGRVSRSFRKAAERMKRSSRRCFFESLEDRRLLATVVTDKLDYRPAETALITASDFQRGESVKFQVLHIDGTPNTGNGHEPWTVTDGGTGDLDGKRDGNISTSWFVDPDDSLGAIFELSALGLSSGLFDTHIFTDAAPPSNGNLFQWDPPGWVTGNNDGPYFEGDTVPYYTSFSNLVVGDTYSITIEWDTTKSGKHALDYLRSYDATIAFPPAVDPAVEAGVNVISTDFFPIPIDTFMTTHPTFNGVQQPGSFKMYNGDMIAVSAYNTPLTYLGDTSTSITVTFVAQDDDGDVNTTTTSAVLTWGGHIATRQDWGLLNSAVNIPGSPYHMRLETFFDVTNDEELGLGNTDRSLSAEAVIFPAIITIIKDAIPDDAQDFAFTTTGTGLANFTLDDDGDNSNTLSNSQQFSVVDFDTKTVTEALVPGWALTNIQISEIGGTDDSTFDIGNRLATLGVQEGEVITVVFTNTVQFGSIAWEKRDEAGNFVGGATFEISPDPTDGVGVMTVVDNGANDADPDPGQILVNNVPVGSYTVTETVSPAGYALDDDATRAVTVSAGALNQVIGIQGQDDAGNGDESDFHNRLGSIAWEKRNEAGAFVGGATFEINLDPLDGVGILTVVDNGANDGDPDAGQILVNNARLGTYTITETISPAGYALDDDTTRIVTVSAADLNAVVGTQGQDDAGNTDESDFHNRLGSIAWEKRNEAGAFVGGATFEINLDPLDGVGILTVVDNGANDADPDAGQILVLNARLGTYTITETISPAGYALDDDATRIVTVSAADLNAVVGTQGQDDAGNGDESDFHNRLGSIAWEKRDEAGNFVGGATFEINLDPLDGVGILTVVDNGANDADPDAGQILVLNARLGTYTITETVSPAGYALDDDATRIVTVSAADLNAVVGTQGQDDAGNGDESDFHNRLGSIAWEKRDEAGNFVGGATFEINLDPLDGVGILTVVDNGANDADPDPGQILVLNARLGTYTITETISPAGYALDDDTTRIVTVSAADLNAVVGTQGQDDAGNTDESDFHNRRGFIAWEKRDEAGNFVGGATFVISPNPLTGSGTLTVIDNGANDADPDQGQLLVNDVLVGSYTVTETVSPAGYALDDDATRLVTVTAEALSATIGTQGQDDPGNTDESDFHNRLGSIAWEKRDEAGAFVGGATFEINLDPLDGVGTLIVVDNGANDADPDAGQILVNNARLGTYTITETVSPAGYALDDDATRIVTVSAAELNVVVGVQGQDDAGNGDESDFHNRLGSIAWEKRDEAGNFVGGATFEINLDPLDGVGTLIVVDNGANDADPDAGQILVLNARLGTYTITETVSPAGYALDDDATRIVTVSAADLNAVVGTQGQDDAGNGDESDFHNRLGSIAWEKRDEAGNFVGGATFEINLDPLDGVGILTVVDNGANDADPDAGQILVLNARLGTYTITETISPAGYALDDDATRIVTVSAADLNAVVGTQGQDDTGDTDESDFHNRRGSIEWEKRDELNNLQGGATFTVSPDPTDGVGVLVVADNGPFDGDLDPGQFEVTNVPLGTYTVTEIIPPPNYTIDDDADRIVTVSALDLNAVIGTQGQDDPGNTDESDFHNIPVPGTKLGTKFEDHNGNGIRDAEDQGLPGWTIFVDYNNDGQLSLGEPSGVTDANGDYTITGIALGTWRIREVLQPGWTATFPVASDAFGRFHEETFVAGSVFPGNDFGNFQLFSISGQKFGDVNQNGIKELNEPRLSGWTIQLDINADGIVDATTVTDALGNYSFTNLGPGIYRVREVQQAGWTQTTANPADIIGASGTNVTDVDFGNFRPGIIVIGPDKSPTAPAPVLILDQATGEVKTSFLAYEPTFVGGTRVATGDLTGDGIDEIITAPGRGRQPQVRVFTQEGVELTAFRTMAYATTFKGGVQVAVGDVNGDGRNDIVTAPSSGKAQIKVFLNQSPNADPIANTSFKTFNAFPTTFVGGAFVRVADMGTRLGNGTFNNTLDGKAEIIVGSGPGIKAAIKVFNVNATPVAVRTINPFTIGTAIYKNGVNFDVARLDGDLIPDIVVGTENGGNSRVETFVWNGSAQLVKTGTFMAFGDSPSKIAPVRVAAIDTNGDGIANQIATVQGPNGTTQQVRIFDINTINPLSVTQSATLAPFPGPYFIAAIGGPAPSQESLLPEGEAFDMPTLGAAATAASLPTSFDLNGDGSVTPSDALLVVNRLNQQASSFASDTSDVFALDVNGDGRLSALDALLIINELNRAAAALAPVTGGGQVSDGQYASDVDELLANLVDGSLLA